MGWTKEQQQAIDTDNKNILVSAAAGSGKTAVLVERVVSHLLRPVSQGAPPQEMPWNVDELLIVTFTKAAAAEMSDRIGQRLQKAITQELESHQPDKALISRLQRQIILLSGASISTIDSFCQSVIKNNFADIDLDPRFRVANENELLLLKQDVLDEIFENRYAKGDELLELFSEKYGTDRGDEELYNIVLKLHEQSRNQPFPEYWLNKLVQEYQPVDKPADEKKHLRDYSLWWHIIHSTLEQEMENILAMRERLSLLIEQVDSPKAREKYDERLERVNSILNGINQAITKEEWQGIYEAFRVLDFKETGFISMPGGKLDVDKELRDEITSTNKELKGAVDKLHAAYVLDPEEVMLEDLARLHGDAEAIIELTLEFNQAYSAAKKEHNIIDYGDMEHYALQLLMTEDSTPEHVEASETALQLRKKYREIMVDEYQDTNQVQDLIVSLIAGENGGNLFIVGDVKQSIYGFRSSEPGLFMDKYKRYDQESKNQQLITLGRNFRSRQEVLAAVNFVFAQLMIPEPAEIDYDQRAMLNPGEPYGYAEAPGQGEIFPVEKAVELDIIMEKGLESAAPGEAVEAQEKNAVQGENRAAGDDAGDNMEELKSFQLEAQHIADRLIELKNSGCLIFDKSLADTENHGYRPVRWRDMVILLRAASSKAEILQEILQGNNIPVFATVDGGYFQTTEIQVVSSLLSVIDNAMQDIPLAAVLYSPIVGLTAEELAMVRLAAEKQSLYQALIQAGSPESEIPAGIKDRVAVFLARLSKWRQQARFMGVPEILCHIYRDTGYYDYVGCMPGGILRQANLRMLIDRAREYESTNYRGLFRFLSFIEKIKSMDTDLSVARSLGENEDVVRVMTIHKSKGLEFPIVVLADMAKSFNILDLKAAVLVHKKLGLGLNNIDTDKSVYYPSFARLAVKAGIQQEIKAEELRVLYVAMTRAREKLIMTGRVANGQTAAKKWCKYREYTNQAAWQTELARPTLPAYGISQANSYLDWVAAAVARHPEAGRSFAELIGLSPEQYGQALGYMHAAMGRESRWQVNLISADDICQSVQDAEGTQEIIQMAAAGKPLPAEEAWTQRINRVLDWHYDFRGTEKIPAKLSVSELKRRFGRELAQSGNDYELLPVESLREQAAEADAKELPALDKQIEYDYPRPMFLQRKEEKHKVARSTEYGTLMHSVMQHLDLHGGLDQKGVRAQLLSMVKREIITQDQLKMVNTPQVAEFFASELGKRMLSAEAVWRELPFCRMLRADSYFPEVRDKDAEIFNQGVIDVLFREADGRLVLIDYKTDRNTEAHHIRQLYAMQLDLYGRAVRSVLDAEVAEKYLYMLRDGSVVRI